MTEASPVLVDTNVILDVIGDDAKWADWSRDQLSRYPSRLRDC